MATETPRQRLVRVRDFVLTVEKKLTDQGAKSLGMIQTYSDQTIAREFTDRWNVILLAVREVGAAVSKALANPDTPDSVLTALADQHTKLGNAINDFNKSAWWEAPSKARIAVEIPFQVAAHVVVAVGTIITQTGASLYSGLNLLSKNAFLILALGLGLYFGVPFFLKTRKAARE